MNQPSDSQLLRAYAENRSEAAFAELVGRHVNFVYSAALRLACDPHLAEDVTQGVFVALAKNAAPLVERPVLSGWLHRTAQNIAAQTVRTIERRRAREQEAVAMNELLADSGTGVPPVWAEIAPHLDAALGELAEANRDAILLRYFERKSAKEMAAQLGISDEAAQKRVHRAVEKLRELFAKRGVTVGAGGLAVVISANAVQAAPVGLALTISTAAALTGTTLATTATVTATKAIAMTTIQKTVVTATLAVLAGAGIYEARQASQLRKQVQTLQQQAPLAEQAQQLIPALNNATNRLTELAAENARLKSNPHEAELLKLRGEVGVLRQQVNEARQNLETAQSYEAKFTKDEEAAANAMKQLNMAMFEWFLNHSEMFPTNLMQLTNELAHSFTRNGVSLHSFDFVNAGSVTPAHPRTVMLRERFARQAPDGAWRRIYGFADGRAITAITADGNFDAWEKVNTDPPLANSQQ